MNGSTSVSPIYVPNLCVCGHDRVQHNAAGTTCSRCLRQSIGGAANPHNFTSCNELWPVAPYPNVLPQGTVTAGGFGFKFQRTAGPANPTGSTTMIFLPGTPPIKAGMSFRAASVSNVLNLRTYRILGVSADNTQVIIPAPGLAANLNNNVCEFFGITGSTMGAGQPPNGQRAG